MITASGKTFDHRDRLKDLGGQWNSDTKAWEFNRLNAEQLTELRAMVGVVVVEKSKPEPQPKRWQDDVKPFDAEEYADEIVAGDKKPFHAQRETQIYGNDQQYFNYFKDTNPISFFGFSSLGDMLDTIDALPSDLRRGPGWEQSGDGWAGTNTMGAALDLARNGWSTGVENASLVAEALSVAHATQRRRKHDVAGGQVSVGRLLSGNPKHMVRRPKQPGRKVVTFFLQGGNHAGIKSENTVVRAAIIAALADIAEREGYSCEIVNVWTVARVFYKDDPATQIVTTLKHAGEKLNLPDLVFALGHPSYLRRLCFALVCSKDELREIYESQGYPTEAFNSYHKPKKNEFYIPLLKYNFKGNNLVDIALKMLPTIMPMNLPVEIKT